MAAIWTAVAAVLVFFPGGLSRWDSPKFWVFACAVLLASLAGAAGRVSRAVTIVAFAVVAVLTVAALVSAQPLVALGGPWPRSTGGVMVTAATAAAWAGARLLGPTAKGPRSVAWERAVSVGSLVLGAVSVLEAVGFRPISSDLARPGALLGNATDQGLVAAVCVALLVPVVADRVARRRPVSQWLLPGSGAAAGIATVAMSGSRAGMLALAVGVVVAWLAWAGPRWRSRLAELRRGSLVGAATLGAAALAILLTPIARERAAGTTGFAAQTVADRALIWGETLELIAANPWWGVGPAGYVDAIAVQHGPAWYAAVTPGTVLESPHNWLLAAAVVGGIPFLLLVLGFVALLGTHVVHGIRHGGAAAQGVAARLGAKGAGPAVTAEPNALAAAWSLRVAGAAGGLAALCVGWLTHFPVPATALLAGVLTGIVCAQVPPAVRGRGRDRVRTAMIAAWCVVLGAVTIAEYPLAAGVSAESAEAADDAFAAAAALRPWDSEVASIAAQTFAAHANAGAHGAGEYGVQWADRALQLNPASVAARQARAISLRAVGDLPAAAAELDALSVQQPHDPRLILQRGVTAVMAGELAVGRELVAEAAKLAPADPMVSDIADWAAGIAEP